MKVTLQADAQGALGAYKIVVDRVVKPVTIHFGLSYKLAYRQYVHVFHQELQAGDHTLKIVLPKGAELCAFGADYQGNRKECSFVKSAVAEVQLLSHLLVDFANEITPLLDGVSTARLYSQRMLKDTQDEVYIETCYVVIKVINSLLSLPSSACVVAKEIATTLSIPEKITEEIYHTFSTNRHMQYIFQTLQVSEKFRDFKEKLEKNCAEQIEIDDTQYNKQQFVRHYCLYSLLSGKTWSEYTQLVDKISSIKHSLEKCLDKGIASPVPVLLCRDLVPIERQTQPVEASQHMLPCKPSQNFRT